MPLRASYRLFKLFNIEVKLHSTFLLLPIFFGFIYGQQYGWIVGLRAFTLVLGVFAFVVMHEFSHSLMALKFGIGVSRITLYPIGGIASMERIPREPEKELWIALVGPLFNFTAALLLYYPCLWTIGGQNLRSASLESWPQTLANLYWANIVLGVFNLIPAFPMDGGRVLRALLSSRFGFVKATRISIFLGHIFAILFALYGVLTGRWMLVLIAGFIFMSASDEGRTVTAYERILHSKDAQ